MSAVGKPKLRVPAASPRSPASDLMEQVLELRKQIELVEEQRDTVAASPRPMAEAAPLVERVVALAAERVRPAVAYLASAEPNGAHDLLDQLRALARSGGGPGHPDMHPSAAPCAFDLLAAVCPDQTKSWLMAALEARYRELPATMPAEQRAAKLAELDAEIVQLEREEAAHLWSAEAAGVRADWRADLSPAVVLGLE